MGSSSSSASRTAASSSRILSKPSPPKPTSSSPVSSSSSSSSSSPPPPIIKAQDPPPPAEFSESLMKLQSAIQSEKFVEKNVKKASDFGYTRRFEVTALQREALRTGAPMAVPKGRISDEQIADFLVSTDPKNLNAESITAAYQLKPEQASAIVHHLKTFRFTHAKYEEPVIGRVNERRS
eukprot:EC851827.1.p1 GENE.EC851827.1~~EC851827.1.p1  ORF type:complete len:188 (+),score=57.04 EC851827.1:25-564(+)